MKTEERASGVLEESYYASDPDIEDPIPKTGLRQDDLPWFRVTAENGPENGPENG